MLARIDRKAKSLAGGRRPAAMRSLASFALASLMTVTPLTVAAQQSVSNVKLSGKVSYSRTSPPTSGVQLLDDIFQRVRSAPQIAMAKNLYKQQMEVAQHQSGPTDYRLAIRPKPTTGKAAGAIADSNSLTVAFAGGGSGGAMSNQRLQAEPIPEMFLGNRVFPLVAKEASSKPSSGVWESPSAPRERREEAKRENDAYNAGYRPPDLATAAGRLYGMTKALQDAEQMASGSGPLAAAQARARADQISFKTRGKDTDDAEGGATKKSADASGARRAVAAKMDSAALPRVNMGKTLLSFSPPQSPPSMDEAGAPMDELLRSNDKAADGGSVSTDEKMNKSKVAMLDIALLPPNVVTGIPMMRLGVSEMQANSALNQIGNMKQQKVNKWTVWSWNRQTGKSGTSMQLFMRNGLLDAMRIFDASLMSSDFGVSLGDSLGRVKEKFGEPAFILQEPGPGAGQNYIYPISQIGFQLARPAPGQQPRVVSVLIFNVK